MEINKTYNTLVVKAPTGSGKTYGMIVDALYSTFCFKKTSIIATKNKKLVDQIYNDTINIYKNETIKGCNISKKPIIIIKHTKDDHAEKELLLDLFIKGEGIIITVHNYLYAFDDFYNVSFLNALSYIFPQLMHLYVDEADFYFNKSYCNHTLINSLIKHNDTLVRGTNYAITENWSSTNNINEAIQVIKPKHYKSTGEDGVALIKQNLIDNENDNNLINLPKFIQCENKEIILKDELFNKCDEIIKLCSDNLKLETVTSKTYELNVNEDRKKDYKISKNCTLTYNYLSTIFKTILISHYPRKYETINSSFQYACFSKKGASIEQQSAILNDMINRSIIPYFENQLFLNEQEKNEFFDTFYNNCEIYKNEAINNKRLFDVVPIETGEEALLNLIYTGYKNFVTFYHPYAEICKLQISQSKDETPIYNIKILKIYNKEVENDIQFYVLKTNTDSLKKTLNTIRKQCLKKNKTSNIEPDTKEENNYNEFQSAKYVDLESYIDKIYAYDFNKLNSKDKKNVKAEIRNYFDNQTDDPFNLKQQYTLEIMLKEKNPAKLVPFGVELEIHKDIDITPRLLGYKRVFSCANFDKNSLNTFIQQNEIFCKEENVKINHNIKEQADSNIKTDIIYLLCSNLNYNSKISNKLFFQQYWKIFVKEFYYCFGKDKSIEETKIGIIGLPSNAKVKDFYDYINFTNYVCYVLASDQKMIGGGGQDEDLHYTKHFNPNQKMEQGGCMFLTSVHSTASVGLNFPHLCYLSVSLNNYKPQYTHKNLSVEINNKLTNPKHQVIQDSLTQIIGRISRIDKHCISQIRILEIQKKPPYEDMLLLSILIPKLLQITNKVKLVDIEKYEKLTISIIRSKKLKKILKIYKEKIKYENQYSLSISICGKYLANFKISLIDLLKNKSFNKDFDIIFKNIVKQYYKDISNIVFMAIIGQIYEYYIDIIENETKIINYSKFKEKLTLSKLSLYNNLYDFIKPFYDELFMKKKNIETFKTLYQSYEKNNKFNLEEFLDNEIKDVNFEIDNTYE